MEPVKAAGALVVERVGCDVFANRKVVHAALILINYEIPLRIIELYDELPGYPQF